MLQDNGTDNLTVSANGPFSFATKLSGGATYAVTVLTQPTGESCVVANGSGTVAGSDVSSVQVTCSTTGSTTGFTVGGSLSGLSGTLALQDNGADTLSLASNGPFTFQTRLSAGSPYSVTISAQPAGEKCSVTNGSGSISGNVTNVAVSCAPQYTIGGVVTNLGAATLVLQDNGADDTTVLPGQSTFTFPTALATGAAYRVTIKTQPNGESCSVSNASGTVSGTVDTVAIGCSKVAQWAWMGGDDSSNAPVYGTEGQPAAANTPGSRLYSATSADTSAVLWLFGGFNCTYGDCSTGNDLADLWTYDTATGEWTWVSGSSKPDIAGVYGTMGTAAAGNLPGARAGAAVWTDSAGNVWLFGGQGYDSSGTLGYLDDLWEYDTSTGEWTWVGGSKLANQRGIYGTQGSAAATNQPGGRQNAVAWIDASNTLWLAGGVGIDSTGNGGYFLSDLWNYNPATREWTWINGPSQGDQAGVYGTRGVAAAANIPGGREYAAAWADPSGGLWLFGGNGLASAAPSGELNDLWREDSASGLWTWMGGASTAGALGVSGSQGVASSSNTPGARYGSAAWVDPSGHFWLFGGQGYDAANQSNVQNDLWEYDPSAHTWTWVAGDGASGGGDPGLYVIQGLPSAGNIPGARYGAMSWSDSSGAAWVYAGFGASPTQASTPSYSIGSADDLWRLGTSTFYNGTGTMHGTYTDQNNCQYNVVSNIVNANVTLGAPSAGALTIYFTSSFTKTPADAATCPGYEDSRSAAIPITIANGNVKSRNSTVGTVTGTLSGATINGTVTYQASGPSGSGTFTWTESGSITATQSVVN